MARKIVIFADGTGNTVGRFDSNVLRLCKMLKTSDQIAIYDPGVGTIATVEELCEALPNPIHVIDDEARRPKPLQLLELPFGLLVGAGTERNIARLYRKLICLYEPGDEIFMFGFSRGAFTARALAGVIYRCGVPRRNCVDQAALAISLSKKHFEACESTKELHILKQAARDFKRTNAHACNIRFLGIWDTVKSVGYMFPRNLPHTRHNPIVQTVRHALSIGERRSFFAHTTWGGLDDDTRPAIYEPVPCAEGKIAPIERQDVQEVWFPGDHSDVGGSHQETALANVSLHWMINEACHAGLRVDESGYLEIIPKIDNLSSCDMHDLSRKFGWWLSEHCPRRDIENEPPPPKLSMLWPNSLGPRQLGPSARQGFVSVHRSAERCYPEAAAPWNGTQFRFIDTVERVIC